MSKERELKRKYQAFKFSKIKSKWKTDLQMILFLFNKILLAFGFGQNLKIAQI